MDNYKKEKLKGVFFQFDIFCDILQRQNLLQENVNLEEFAQIIAMVECNFMEEHAAEWHSGYSS